MDALRLLDRVDLFGSLDIRHHLGIDLLNLGLKFLALFDKILIFLSSWVVCKLLIDFANLLDKVLLLLIREIDRQPCTP